MHAAGGNSELAAGVLRGRVGAARAWRQPAPPVARPALAARSRVSTSAAAPSDGHAKGATVRELAHPVVARVGHVEVLRIDSKAGGAQQLALPAALGADAAPVAQPRRGVPHGDAPVTAVSDEER